MHTLECARVCACHQAKLSAMQEEGTAHAPVGVEAGAPDATEAVGGTGLSSGAPTEATDSAAVPLLVPKL